jgi:predicted Zn-dependent peptidase
LDVAARELAGLRNISEADLQLAKQSLKGRINRNNLSTAKRLEWKTKTLYYLGQTNENLASQIDGVTLAQVQEAVANSLKTPLTYVSRGGEVSSLPSYDNVTKLFD